MSLPEIDAAGAAALPGALLLDVREQDEWDAGHAPSARHVPLGELPAHVASLPSDRRIVCICRSGNRSARATQFLRAQGLDAVNLTGGMRAWAAAGLALVAEGHAAPAVI